MTINEFKTWLDGPTDVDKAKKIAEEYNLHYYTHKEEALNVLTHFLGVVFSVIGLVLMVLKATTPASIATAVLCPIGFLALYTNSTVYHFIQNPALKATMRKVDYCSVNIIVISCGTGVALLTGHVAGYAIYATCFGLVVLALVLSLVNFRKFRMVSFAMNFVIGALLVGAYFLTDTHFSTTELVLNAVGIASVIVGSVLFAIHKPYVHAVFHLFVLVGPILFWTANYLMIS
jgi:hemolysin III